MNSLLRRSRLVCGVCLMFGLVAFQTVEAAPRSGSLVVLRVVGAAEYQAGGTSVWQPLEVGVILGENTRLRTGDGGSLDLALTTGAIIRLNENSRFQLNRLAQETKGLPAPGNLSTKRTEMTLERGWMLTEVGRIAAGSSFRVNTPLGVVEATGTKALARFLLWSDSTRFYLRTLSGEVVLRSGARTITVGQEQQIAGLFDSQSGQATLDQDHATATPMGDATAVQYAQFLNAVQSVEAIVVNQDTVNVNLLLQTSSTRTASGSTTLLRKPPPVNVSPSSP